MSVANFAEARERLSLFYMVSSDYKLDVIKQFLSYLGNPQDNLKVVHIAGTSGKTSTAYYCAALLKAVGYKVGLTVSPHVDEINERVQINLEPLPEDVFCRELDALLALVAESGLKLSYFEVMVAFAYWKFAKDKVDYAVVEVGLGGRIDGTNVVSRSDKVCAITDIGFDHTKILGTTLPEITAEKAGIIGEKNEVFTHRQVPEILDVIKDASKKQHAKLHVVDEKNDLRFVGLPLFQRHNIQLAVAVCSYVLAKEHKKLADSCITEAARAYIPARMEIVEYAGKTIIVDGAHNGQKLHTLLASIADRYQGLAIAGLVAFVDGDEVRMSEGVHELIKNLNHIIVTEFKSEQDVPKQSVSAKFIVETCKRNGFGSIEEAAEPEKALALLLDRPEPILLVTGSFYLLNHVRPHIMGL